MVTVLAVVLTVGMAALIAPHIKAVLSASPRADEFRAAPTAGDLRTARTVGFGTAGKAGSPPDGCATDAGTGPAGAGRCRSGGAGGAPRVMNVSCDLVVPAHPLSAAGLATAYRLTGPGGAAPAGSGCTMANAASLGAFVQATILDPGTGKLWVYEPLVITQGTRPAVAPVVPRLPAGAVVTVDVGFNGAGLTLVGATREALGQGHCHNGMGTSIFGQVSFCHGAYFFAAARRAQRQGKLAVPRTGVSPKTGQPCPTTRSFTLVDQDPSDNVTTAYLLTSDGRTAQDSTANAAALPHAAVIANGSDNALLGGFVDPVLGCAPFTAPDLSRGGAPGTSQALDELSAAANQAAPVALVPENDPMVEVHNAFSALKTNQYRASLGQPAIAPGNRAADSPARFCQNMISIQARFLASHAGLVATAASPIPATGTNLLTFMASRLSASYATLNCQHYGLHNPVTITRNRHGTAIAATFTIPPTTKPNHPHGKG
jgi:hypothetical protein